MKFLGVFFDAIAQFMGREEPEAIARREFIECKTLSVDYMLKHDQRLFKEACFVTEYWEKVAGGADILFVNCLVDSVAVLYYRDTGSFYVVFENNMIDELAYEMACFGLRYFKEHNNDLTIVRRWDMLKTLFNMKRFRERAMKNHDIYLKTGKRPIDW